MNYLPIEASLVALIPAILLCIYVYAKDKVEKEPVGLLLILFFAGAAVCVPSSLLEKAVVGGLDKLFEGQMSFGPDGTPYYQSMSADIAHKALCSFLGFALIQVTVKWLILVLITRKSKHFNYLFDGIVYSVFIALGYAACENICYAAVNGWDRLSLRTVTTLPSHLFVGIVMGYCYTLWHFYSVAQKKEKQLVSDKALEKRKIRSSVVWGVVNVAIPVVLFGVYSFAGSFTSGIMVTLFYALVILTYIFCFVKIHSIAKKDTAGNVFVNRLILKFHPELDKSFFAAETENNVASDSNGIGGDSDAK